ncbi:MAG: type III PLP-dependent enzyme [Acidobacteriota bacterium]
MTPQIETLIHRLRAERNEPVCAYIYDLTQLRAHIAQIVTTLPRQCRFFYAIKANSQAPILRALAPYVHGYEVASQGELEKVRAISADVPIIFGGPGKTEAELAVAIRQGAKLLHVESAQELDRIQYLGAAMGKEIPILLRVNLRGLLPAATLKMSGVATQFGIDEIELPDLITQALRSRNIMVQGFHFHSISNNLDAVAHAQLIDSYIARAHAWSAEYRINLSYLNVGGGIGVNYAELDRQFAWDIFVQELNQVLNGYDLPGLTLLFECGRYVTAACGYYAAEVLDIKQNHATYYVIVRGGTHHFRLPVSWQHSHPFIVISMEDWSYPFPRRAIERVNVTIVGQLCTPKDRLAFDAFVSRVRIGDVILFCYTGAYGWAISHHDFLSHPKPEQIFIGDWADQ